MFQINRQTDYAIRIILTLSKHPLGAQKSTAEIRDEMLIPPALAQRIIAELARGEFVLTFPGRDGGVQLARPASQINLLEVIEFMQGPIYISECLATEGEPCPFGEGCPVQKRWARLRAMIRAEMESQTFDHLAQDAMGILSIPSGNETQDASS